MRIMMISNPNSMHTLNWVNELKNLGIEVIVLFVKDWMKQQRREAGDLGVETILLDSPSRQQMIQKIIGKLSIGSTIRDVRNRTRIHQQLSILGEEVKRIAMERNIDIIHAHGMTTSALLARASEFHPYSASAWGSDIYIAPEKYPYLRKLIQDAIVQADFIQVESKMSADRVLELAPISREKLLLSPWGVNIEEYAPKQKRTQMDIGLNIEDRRIILSFRSLEPIYQTHYIIKAFRAIAEKYQDAFLVIGSDGSERESLETLVKELNLEQRVHFTGFVNQDIKKFLLTHSYCYVQCPASDGVAITVMEAMACGQPVISSDAGENKVHVLDGIQGILVKPPYNTNISLALDRILGDAKYRDILAINAREYALKHFNRAEFFVSFERRCISSINECATER